MKIFSKTDIGLLRDENQDCVWSASLSDGACAAVLCDGMGGEAHGGLASQNLKAHSWDFFRDDEPQFRAESPDNRGLRGEQFRGRRGA